MSRSIEILFLATLVYTPLALGGARLWAITPVFIATLLMLSLFLLKANARDEAVSFRPTVLAAPLLVFLGLSVASCFTSCYPHASILELYRILTYIAIYYIVVNALGSREQIGRIVGTIVACGALLSFIGLILYLGHRYYNFWLPCDTVSATYMNRDHFAGYLEMAIPLAVGFLFTDISRTKKVLTAFLAILMIVAFVMAACRGAWVSLVFSSFIVLPFVSRRRLLKAVALLVLIMGTVLFFALSHFDTSFAADRARTIVEGVGVDETRIVTWMGTVDLIKAHPLFGSGLGTFLYAFPQFRPVGIHQYFLMDYAHNDYLQMAAEMGLIGLALMLWVIIAAVWVGLGQFLRTGSSFKRGISLGATIGVMSMAMHSFVDFNLHIPANAILFTTLIAIIMAMHRRRYE